MGSDIYKVYEVKDEASFFRGEPIALTEFKPVSPEEREAVEAEEIAEEDAIKIIKNA